MMRLSLVSLLHVLAMGQTSSSPPPREWHAAIARGVELFRAGRYADATATFEQAEALRPQDPVSHLYIGLAWKQQFVPGAIVDGTGGTSGVAARAEREFRRALELDGQNWPALVLLGQLMLEERRFDEARALYKKALDADPTNADIWCTLGAIAWQQAKAAARHAQPPAMREPRGMPGASPIEQGLADVHHALQLAPQQVMAMEWLDALLRLRASFGNTSADASEAEEWRRKAHELRASRGLVEWPPMYAGTWPLIRDFASFAVRQPAPPSPPPPPDPSRMTRMTAGTAAVGWTFRHVPGADEPPPMLVNPAAQERNLLRKVDPAQTAGTGVVRLDIVIDRGGSVKTAKVISGDARLADAARAAVLQWTYRPTVSNGEPVAVRTEVDISF